MQEGGALLGQARRVRERGGGRQYAIVSVCVCVCGRVSARVFLVCVCVGVCVCESFETSAWFPLLSI